MSLYCDSDISDGQVQVRLFTSCWDPTRKYIDGKSVAVITRAITLNHQLASIACRSVYSLMRAMSIVAGQITIQRTICRR